MAAMWLYGFGKIALGSIDAEVIGVGWVGGVMVEEEKVGVDAEAT
jgi:hypothetical protein